jgi:hypothetical protein
VWLSDRALDADEGAVGNALLRVELNIDDPEIAQFDGPKKASPTGSGSFPPV